MNVVACLTFGAQFILLCLRHTESTGKEQERYFVNWGAGGDTPCPSETSVHLFSRRFTDVYTRTTIMTAMMPSAIIAATEMVYTPRSEKSA